MLWGRHRVIHGIVGGDAIKKQGVRAKPLIFVKLKNIPNCILKTLIIWFRCV